MLYYNEKQRKNCDDWQDSFFSNSHYNIVSFFKKFGATAGLFYKKALQ